MPAVVPRAGIIAAAVTSQWRLQGLLLLLLVSLPLGVVSSSTHNGWARCNRGVRGTIGWHLALLGHLTLLQVRLVHLKLLILLNLVSLPRRAFEVVSSAIAATDLTCIYFEGLQQSR
jgi:hypothetical protein